MKNILNLELGSISGAPTLPFTNTKAYEVAYQDFEILGIALIHVYIML